MLEEYLRICGIPFLIYAVARLLDYWRKSIDSEKKYWRWIFLNVICFALWIASFPVSLIMRGLNYLHENLIEYNNRMDDIKRSREICESCRQSVIQPLRDKISRLEDENMDNYFDAKEEGYIQGLRDGTKEGYRSGYSDCLEESLLPVSKRQQLELEAMRYSICFSNERIKEYEREKNVPPR